MRIKLEFPQRFFVTRMKVLMIKIIFINMAKNAFHEGAFFSAIREDFPLWAGLIRL